jgi:hypothetical protein
MDVHILIKRTVCVLRELLPNSLKVKALARCDATPWILRKESVDPTWRKPPYNQTWTAQCYGHTVVIQKLNHKYHCSIYMERTNDSTKFNASRCTSNNLHESRFKILLFIFRLSGLPFKLQSVSRIYAVYSATIMVCFYTTTVCLFMDTFIHRHQLDYAMKKLRVFLGFSFALWMHISIR